MSILSRRFIFETLHPEIYHGRQAKRPFFEGWYFKVIDDAGENVWAIIPGIYCGREAALDEAFVMVLDGRLDEVSYDAYPVSEFAASTDSFDIRIGPNFFSEDHLTLNLAKFRGHLSFQERTPWPVSWRSPGIMGWYGWFPMECYHGVISMDHGISGLLVRGDERFELECGRGYIEKDWGSNFPQTWIWIQANFFEERDVSLSASIARIPFYGRVFPGFIIGLLVAGRLYRFATYLGSTLEEVRIEGERASITVRSKDAILEIWSERGRTVLLHAPTPGKGMVPRVRESVDALVAVRLRSFDGTMIFEGESRHGGMEIEGDTTILIH